MFCIDIRMSGCCIIYNYSISIRKHLVDLITMNMSKRNVLFLEELNPERITLKVHFALNFSKIFKLIIKRTNFTVYSSNDYKIKDSS